MRKKVFFLKTHMSADGGLEKYTYRLMEAFIKKGHFVSVCTSSKFESSQIKNHLIRLPMVPRFLKALFFDQYAQNILKKEKPHIIFGMDRTTNQTHIRAGNGVHKAYLEKRKHFESFWKKPCFSLSSLHQTTLYIEKKAFENPNLKKLFTNSHMVKKEILRFYNTDPKKIQVIHNGVEYKEWEKPFLQWKNEREIFLKEKKLPQNVFHFLFIGHNFQRKGLFPLMQALSQIKEEVHLSVIGHDKKIKKYELLAQKLKIEKKIRFFGRRKDVLSFYQMADSLVIPSFYDPFANVTLEALSMGLFVVSSKTNGGSEVLNSENGIIIEDLADIDSIKKALLVALKNPKTFKSAQKIRLSAKPYDFSQQLTKMVDETLL